MSLYQVHIQIMPLNELLDPQGKAVSDTLHKMNLTAISNVRVGKHITLQVEANDKDEAHQIAETACKQLLYNAVMEQYTITVL
jgi:phosphoribosylformylglycinamidine synthase subunit PurS